MSELLSPRTPGAVLRAARERCRFSIADVVEATRIKTHIIEALENDDYSVIAAPLYGKGFIKIYAEHVGVDPAPLIRHYLNNYARTVRPTLKTELPPPSAMNDGMPMPSPLARFKESGGSALTQMMNTAVTTVRDVMLTISRAWDRFQAARREAPPMRSRLSSTRNDYSEEAPFPIGRYAAVGFAALVVVILVVSGVYLLSGSKETSSAAGVRKAEPPSRITPSRPLRLAERPPAPYIKLK